MSIAMTRKFVSPEPDSDYEAGGRPLTGWKVLAIFVSLFGVVLAANGVMMYQAVKTFRGEVVQHPYERGITYNRDIAQARAQDARDWRVDVSFKRGATGDVDVVVLAKESAGAPVTGVDMSATFVAPADVKKDAGARLIETAVGRYEGRIALPAGIRDLVVTATQANREVFRSTSRVAIE